VAEPRAPEPENAADGAVQGDPDLSGVPSLYRTAWGVYLVMAIGAVLWLGAGRGALPLDLFLVPASIGRDLLWGVGACLVLLVLWAGAAALLAGPRRLERLMAEMLGPLDGSEVVALALISGFAEEIFFRGAMQQSWGLWPTVGVFALLHTGPGRAFLWWTGFAAIAGALFGWLVIHRGTLLPAIVAHVLVNAINLQRLRRLHVADSA
jgi:membrane protease YdiL (CAAX protease family)